jgi:imidazole glycerol phosphate synthase glutamine amidotransferase subunit
VQNTLDEIGATYTLVRDSEGLTHAAKIILPGVGHFGQMLRALDEMQVRAVLKERIAAGVPFLGICLGLQGLFERSAEAPEVEGLGVFSGTVERFPLDARCPQMGWNTLRTAKPSRLLAGLGDAPYVYFANSYYVPVCAEAAATTEYARPFTSALESGNTFGVQFHPEKSGPIGLRIMSNFVEL